jgi:hypothetical protein
LRIDALVVPENGSGFVRRVASARAISTPQQLRLVERIKINTQP